MDKLIAGRGYRGQRSAGKVCMMKFSGSRVEIGQALVGYFRDHPGFIIGCRMDCRRGELTVTYREKEIIHEVKT